MKCWLKCPRTQDCNWHPTEELPRRTGRSWSGTSRVCKVDLLLFHIRWSRESRSARALYNTGFSVSNASAVCKHTTQRISDQGKCTHTKNYHRLWSAKYFSCANVTPMFLPSHLRSPPIVRWSIHFGSCLFPSMALFALMLGAGLVVLHVQRHAAFDRSLCNSLSTIASSSLVSSSAVVFFSPLGIIGSSWLASTSAAVFFCRFCTIASSSLASPSTAAFFCRFRLLSPSQLKHRKGILLLEGLFPWFRL